MNCAKKAALTVTAAGLAAGASHGLDVQVPVDVPVTVTGLSANLVAALNPTFGTITANH